MNTQQRYYHILDLLSDAQKALTVAQSNCHSYVDDNNLPNARMGMEVAMIGQALGNVNMTISKLKAEGLPTE